MGQLLKAVGLPGATKQLNAISRAIIKNMRAAGFDGGGARGLEAQLRHAVSQFQRANDLPASGRFDQSTIASLKEQGLLQLPGQQARGQASPRAEGRAGVQAPPAGARDGYAKATQNKLLPQSPRPLPRAEGQKAQGESFLSFLANLLKGTLGVGSKAGGGGAEPTGGAQAAGGGEAGAAQGGGGEARAEARPQEARPQQARPAEPRAQERQPQQARPQQAQPQDARAQAGRGTAGQGAAAGGAAREAAAAARPATQARADGAPNPAAPTGAPAARSRTVEQQRVVSTTAAQDPTSKGLPQDQGDLEAFEGEGRRVGERRGRGQGGEDEQGAPEEADGEGGVGQEEELEATERDAGNAPSGEEQARTEERGHATLDDGSEAEAGYYRVPPLSQQIQEALATIRREDERDHRTTTYTWDLTLYRPAVYGAGQQAQAILHLVVDSATAYDEVWGRARDEVNKHLRRLEPDAAPLELDDIVRALQRARVADG